VGKSQRRAIGKATINRCLLAVCVSILIGAIALGAFSLQGFAMGEQLHELLDDEALAEVEKSPYMHSPDALQFELSDWNDFPEVRLQIGALRQEHAQILVRTAQDWPNEMTDAMRSAISKPEFFSAVLQSSGEEELGALKEIVEKQAGVSTELRKSIEDMRAAITACPLDWRANWGLLRANDGSLQANERLYNYARIYLSCRNHPSVLQAAANHALMTGDDQFGLHIWRELLRTNSYARVRIANLLGNLLDVGQLIEILPPSPLSRLEIAARLNVLQKSSEALDVVQTIDFEQAFTEAKSAVDWRQLAWAAGLLGDVDYRIESLEKAALASPMDAETRYNLALELLQVEKFAEAKEEIDRAMKLSANNTKYKQLSEQIQQAQKH
jgi:tetratricopeptide (TPR) repeat protein